MSNFVQVTTTSITDTNPANNITNVVTPVFVSDDFGDAPNTYGTLLANNGPRHRVLPNSRLGLLEDTDPDGQPSTLALGDDFADANDDEDGVFFIGPLVGQQMTIAVVASAAGSLDCWIDYNRNGVFDHATEYVPPTMVPAPPGSKPLLAGTNIITFNMPANFAITSSTFARFRFSSAGDLLPTGPASDGEVEDYRILLDYGDAPASFGVGSHSVPTPPTPFLGAGVDVEFASQHVVPPAVADLDDLDRVTDDEDGVIFRSPLVAGLLATVQVTAGAPGKLDFWIDYNGNGSFQHNPGDTNFPPGINNELVPNAVIGHTNAGSSLTLAAGVHQIRFFVPNNVIANVSYARFRFSTAGWLTPDDTGFLGFPAADGEVEDYRVQLFDLAPDFGDAPDSDAQPRYPTLLSHNGAVHLTTVANFQLGQRLDYEDNGRPDADALGDDMDDGLEVPDSPNPDDEDGVTFVSTLLPGKPASIQVAASVPGGVANARLNAWIDFNHDFDWSDPGERILTNATVVNGNNAYQFPVPAGALSGRTFARFRLNDGGNLQPFGSATSGEVEDYSVTIAPKIEKAVVTGTNIVIRWSRDTDGYVVDYADSLTAPIQWQQASVPVMDDGTNNFVTIPIDPTKTKMYYRLRYGP